MINALDIYCYELSGLEPNQIDKIVLHNTLEAEVKYELKQTHKNPCIWSLLKCSKTLLRGEESFFLILTIIRKNSDIPEKRLFDYKIERSIHQVINVSIIVTKNGAEISLFDNTTVSEFDSSKTSFKNKTELDIWNEIYSTYQEFFAFIKDISRVLDDNITNYTSFEQVQAEFVTQHSLFLYKLQDAYKDSDAYLDMCLYNTGILPHLMHINRYLSEMYYVFMTDINDLMAFFARNTEVHFKQYTNHEMTRIKKNANDEIRNFNRKNMAVSSILRQLDFEFSNLNSKGEVEKLRLIGVLIFSLLYPSASALKTIYLTNTLWNPSRLSLPHIT
jgi:hypothetical protein